MPFCLELYFTYFDCVPNILNQSKFGYSFEKCFETFLVALIVINWWYSQIHETGNEFLRKNWIEDFFLPLNRPGFFFIHELFFHKSIQLHRIKALMRFCLPISHTQKKMHKKCGHSTVSKICWLENGWHPTWNFESLAVLLYYR